MNWFIFLLNNFVVFVFIPFPIIRVIVILHPVSTDHCMVSNDVLGSAAKSPAKDATADEQENEDDDSDDKDTGDINHRVPL